uniref:Uncharacterized protein n=1 Tax=Aquisalinus luteolus TaxID=1566827 RepID=A0A8J3A0L8_9PROT|nr:hypothetical protein GCM10011355_04500 [Aquisalinus luteolus]
MRAIYPPVSGNRHPCRREGRARVGARGRDRHSVQTDGRESSLRAADQNAAVESEQLFRSSKLSKLHTLWILFSTGLPSVFNHRSDS